MYKDLFGGDNTKNIRRKVHEHLTKNSISICDNRSIELGFSGAL